MENLYVFAYIGILAATLLWFYLEARGKTKTWATIGFFVCFAVYMYCLIAGCAGPLMKLFIVLARDIVLFVIVVLVGNNLAKRPALFIFSICCIVAAVYMMYFNTSLQEYISNSKNTGGEKINAAVSKKKRSFAGTGFVQPRNKQLYVQQRHAEFIEKIVFTPDSEYFLSSSRDESIRLWETASGREIHNYGTWDRSGNVLCKKVLALSPDGKLGISASGRTGNEAALWETASGKRVGTFKGNESWEKQVICAAFSPDGKYVLLLDLDRYLRVWDIDSAELVREFKIVSPVESADFGSDGKYVMTDTLAKWELATGKQVPLEIENVSRIAVSNDFRYVLASGKDDTAIKLREWQSKKEIRSLKGHSDTVVSLAFSPDGKYALSGSKDKTIRVWNVKSGKQIQSFPADDRLKKVAFSPNGKYALSESTGIAIWDIASGKQIRSLERCELKCLTLSPDCKHGVLTCSHKTKKNEILIFNVESGEEIPVRGHAVPFNNLVFSPDGKYLLSGSGKPNSDASYFYPRLWDLESGKLARFFENTVSAYGKIPMAVRADGRYAMVGLTLIDLNTGGKMSSFGKSYAGSAAFSSNGKYVLSGFKTEMSLWDAASGKKVRSFDGGERSGWIKCVAFSSDNKHAMSGSDRIFATWDLVSGKKINTFEPYPLTADFKTISVAFTPNGKYTLIGRSNGELTLWETASGKKVRSFAGHTSGVAAVDFSNDAKIAVSGGGNGIVRLWDVVAGKEIRAFKGHTKAVDSVGISPDGGHVMSGSSKGRVMIYRKLNSGDEIYRFYAFSDNEWIVTTPDGEYRGSPDCGKYLNLQKKKSGG